MNKYRALLIGAAALLLAGCGRVASAPAPNNQCVCTLIDASASAVAERSRLLEEFYHVVDALNPGDIFAADLVTENPYATVRFPVREALPVMDATKTTAIAHKKALAAAKQSILERVEQMLKAVPEKGEGSIQQTALMDAVAMAAKYLNGNSCQQAHRRVLLVLTDGIEDSARANFTTADLSPKAIERIINREKAEHRLPDLGKVDVWMVGTTPDRRMNPQRIRNIEAFWEAYFSATGTRLDPQKYGASLLEFGKD